MDLIIRIINIFHEMPIAALITVCFIFAQVYWFATTWIRIKRFKSFFSKSTNYSMHLEGTERDKYPQLDMVGGEKSELNALIREINTYLGKTKGTSDYEFIRRKVERKLKMTYDQSTMYLSFPTYLGLMGTFWGVLCGIYSFLDNFDSNSITDESIQTLLCGVLMSMSTSFLGIILTTVNNASAGDARKFIQDAKDEFYDFIQTEVTKTASASLVAAISNLHDTVDKFEPAFSTVIEGFKSAFKECTKAFGEDFKENVHAVTSAVVVMGKNMDKINENIDLQKKVLDTLKSREFVHGMDKYIEASNHFVGITQSLNKFEEARRMMLAAAQEAISIQNQYNESLKVPREIAIRVNQILDRVKDFEKNVNEAGRALNKRDILGNDVINAIQDQIKGIAKKGKIADQYLGIAEGKLEDLFKLQTEAINDMNKHYKAAIEEHIEGFETMLSKQTEDLTRRHDEFTKAIEVRLNAEDIRQEFTNLRRLEAIEQKINTLTTSMVKPVDVHRELQEVQKELKSLKNELIPELSAINKNTVHLEKQTNTSILSILGRK